MHHPVEQALVLDGPAGALEARLRAPRAGGTVTGAAALFPPHPLHGGSLDNKTLYRLAKRLARDAGLAALRVNFRGVGTSEGTHDGGAGEVDDALAALEALARLYPGLPLTAIGYSFGAVVGLRAGAADERVVRLVALGLPLGPEWDTDFLRGTRKPRLFVQGERDRFGDRAALEGFARSLTGPVETKIIPGASHLFTGREDEAVEAVVGSLRDTGPA